MKLQLVDASYSGIVEVSVSVQTASGDVAAALDSGFRRMTKSSVPNRGTTGMRFVSLRGIASRIRFFRSS